MTNLRFIERDGKKILQSCTIVSSNKYPDEEVWRDVPLVKEEKPISVEVWGLYSRKDMVPLGYFRSKKRAKEAFQEAEEQLLGPVLIKLTGTEGVE